MWGAEGEGVRGDYYKDRERDRRGGVERFPSPEDGRVVLVRVTDEGRRRHGEVAARRSTAMMRILSEFDRDERAQLADMLDRFVEALDEVVGQLAAEEEAAAEADDD